MGWFGYGTYGGDNTQSQHSDFLKWAKVSKSDDEIDSWMTIKGTKIPEDKKVIFETNIDMVLKKMPKKINNEDKALSWQMLAALYVDNKIPIPEGIKDRVTEAIELLCEEQHSGDFNEPAKRRRSLRNFLKKVQAI